MIRVCIALGILLAGRLSFAADSGWTLRRDGKQLTIGGKTYEIETATALSREPGTRYYLAKNGMYAAGVFGVHIPESAAGKTSVPLVLDSHGKGGDGASGVAGWAGWAEQYGFIVVCPSFGYATGAGSLGETDRVLCEIMERALKDLPVDRLHVLGTGFSGGALVAYESMMQHPEWFTALSFRGPNFRALAGSSAHWRKVPIYILWGEQDHPMIYSPPESGQGPRALNLLLNMKGLAGEFRKRSNPVSFEKAGSFKWDQIPGGGHDGRADLVSKWFAGYFGSGSRVEDRPDVVPEDTPEPEKKEGFDPEGFLQRL
jgi:hypothetical protein